MAVSKQNLRPAPFTPALGPDPAACPECGVVSTSVKARVSTSPRDIPYGHDRVIVRWHKTCWRCKEDYCERSRSPRPSRRSGRGHAQPRGCATRSARRSAMPAVQWPRSPPPTGCRGRPRTAPLSPTPRRR
ncbi:transposase [Mycobacterium sp. MOTT36Y]|nr:transposase [Mycobacterium sp. MOTT36Y]